MEILSPVWPAGSARRPPRRRPQTLDGATVALVDDNLDIPFTTHLESLLAERHRVTVRRLVKPSGTAPSPPAIKPTMRSGSVPKVGGHSAASRIPSRPLVPAPTRKTRPPPERTRASASAARAMADDAASTAATVLRSSRERRSRSDRVESRSRAALFE